MTDQAAPRYHIDPYLDWVKKEGLNSYEDYGLYLFDLETKMWPRIGVKAAAAHLKGRGDFANMFLFEIDPGGSTSPQRHMYEEVVYVLEGSGSTQLELQDGARRSFEWGPRAMFAIPLNAKYRHFNASGQKRALIVSTTNLPMIMNTFYNEQFVFDNNFEFPERLGKEGYFTGEGDLVMTRPGNHMWETNFVPDLMELELQKWGDRGAGATNIMFVLANGLMHAHLSEMPVGTYKKGHKHGPGTHVMIVDGTGYSLLWMEGDQDFMRLDWRHGMVFPPAEKQFHQHFNTGANRTRYLATGVGSIRYPMFAFKRRASGVGGGIVAVSTSTKLGGDQIEYEDQDARIHPLFVEEMKKTGVPHRMDPYFPVKTAAE